jgi:hypothetical protein
MAQFSWAYVDCNTISGNCKGPDGAVQVHHGGVNGNPTGSQAFLFTTSSVPYSLYVSGNMEIAAFNEDPDAPGANLTDGGVLYAKPDGNLYWRTSGEIVDLTMDTGSSGGPSGSIQFRKGETNTFTGSAALVYDETPTVTTLYSTAVISGSSTLHNVGAVTMGSTLATSGNIDTAGDMTAATITMTGFAVDADGDTALKSLKVDNGSTVGCDADTDMLTFNGNTSPASLDVASNIVLKAGIISGSSTLQAIGAATLGSTLNVTGATFLSGGLVLNHVMKNSSTYTITTSDYYIGLDTTSNAITVTLPQVANCTPGQTYVIKDEGGAAASNNITIEGAGSEKVDGQINQTINSNYASLSLYCGGARGWFIF